MTVRPETSRRAPPSRSSAADDFENFIYLLSHDVRNSVRAMLELPQWIEEDLVAEGHPIRGSLAENFRLLNTHTRRLDRMLIDLLEYSRVGRKQQIRTVLLQDALRQLLEARPIPPGFRLDSDLRAGGIRIGENDVLNLLSALIGNAVKHHDKGGGTITVTARNEGGDCVLVVRDDGPGIPGVYRERVFGAMTTLRPRDDVEGSGMGLAIVRKIVDHYGGSLRWLMQHEEEGAALEIRLPLAADSGRVAANSP